MTALPQLLPIPGGEFLMGKDDSRKDEAPAHRVVVRPFRAAASPVTNAQWLAYAAAAGLERPPFMHEERFAAPELPVVGISWHDAVAYCDWLVAQTGIPYRLPSEAEREFAALGGLPGGDWPWPGEGHPIAGWIDALDGPHDPRDECANGYGLRCMAENVHEWCSDWYDAAYYAVSPADNPGGPDGPSARRASRG